jgi:hypothetical protein
VPEPPWQLEGYAKVTLKPGRSARVSFPLNDRSFAHWSVARKAWKVTPGCYGVAVGSSSRDLVLRGWVNRRVSTCPVQTAVACRSRRTFVIHLDRRARSGTVTIGGRAVRVRRVHGRLQATIDLRKVTARKVRVVTRIRTARGRVVRRTRKYHPCRRRPRGG